MPRAVRTTHDSAAERLGLIIITVDDLTIERVDDGFRHANGRTVGKRRLAQIGKLVLPPAWTTVRVARDHRAHLQAIGRDTKGRVQYRYHDKWVRVRDAVKAERLLAFGGALARIRATVDKDMRRSIEDRRAVVATAVRLIDRQLLRVGSERYARNGTRGASTLLVENALENDGDIELDYTAKSGKAVRLSIRDRALARRLKRLRKTRAGKARRRKSQRLFEYRGDDGRRHSLTAREINAYLTQAAARRVSAKDFRTFAGSAMAMEHLVDGPCPRTLKEREKALSSVVKAVSERLRNTPAVARASYIHPAIAKAYVRRALDANLTRTPLRKGLNAAETGLVRFLEEELR